MAIAGMTPLPIGILCALSGSSLLAQTVAASLTALTPLQCTVVQGAATAQQTLPAGPLSAWGQVAASLGNPGNLASATFGWTASSSTSESLVSLTFANQLDGAGSTSVDPGEVLVTFTGSSPTVFPVRYVVDFAVVSGGGSSPWVRIDRDNDGTIDWTMGGGAFGGSIADLSAQPLQLRVLFSELRAQPGAQILCLNLRIVPDNGVVVTPILANCSDGLTTYSVRPLFDTSLVDVEMRSSRVEWHVLGLGVQPTLLPPALTLTSSPCLLVPTPDSVLRTGTLFLRIPSAVRPITLYSQLLMLQPGSGLRVSDGYILTAR